VATAAGLLTLALLPTGCLSGSQPSSASSPMVKTLPTTTVTLGDKQFTLEISNTDSTRETGLMYRDSMPADHGMIFVFPDPQTVSFYMKNTRIPLDIVFVDPAGKVISVHQMQPYVEYPTTDSESAVRWAIELNLNAASGAGVKPGDQLNIPKEAS
jgi:uncharacterized membrane protein (UPF0127 family)